MPLSERLEIGRWYEKLLGISATCFIEVLISLKSPAAGRDGNKAPLVLDVDVESERLINEDGALKHRT